MHGGAGRLHWLILDVGVRRPNQPWKWPAWLVLTKPDRERLTTMLRQNEKPVWHAGAELRGCFQRIGQAVELDRDGSSVSRLAALINELLVLVLEMFSLQRIALDESLSGSRRTVELLLGELRDDLSQLARPWALGDLAERCGLGPTRFVQLCKQLTNMTPTQYLTHHRVEAASRMLRQQADATIADVGRPCGFASGQYFATVFRRHLGQSPTEWGFCFHRPFSGSTSASHAFSVQASDAITIYAPLLTRSPVGLSIARAPFLSCSIRFF